MASESTPARRLSSYHSFRKLSKNDVYQTTEQWKERTLLRLGDVSGEWTTWVKKDAIPTVPVSRPIAPVKPNSKGLMNSYKATILQRCFRDLMASQPKPAEGTSPRTLTIEDVPMPDERDV